MAGVAFHLRQRLANAADRLAEAAI
jgi:hypothetical protein